MSEEFQNPLYQPNRELYAAAGAAHSVERVTRAFRETITPPVDVVTYSEFKVTMLPLLAAIANGADFDQARWESLVSHRNAEVAVVDDATHRELYRISSVFYNTDVGIDDPNMMGTSVYASEIENYKHVSVPAAQQMLLEIVNERIVPTTEEEMFNSGLLAIARLNKIFEDHDLPILPDPREYFGKIVPEAEKTEVVSIEEDEFDAL